MPRIDTLGEVDTIIKRLDRRFEETIVSLRTETHNALDEILRLFGRGDKKGKKGKGKGKGRASPKARSGSDAGGSSGDDESDDRDPGPSANSAATPAFVAPPAAPQASFHFLPPPAPAPQIQPTQTVQHAVNTHIPAVFVPGPSTYTTSIPAPAPAHYNPYTYEPAPVIGEDTYTHNPAVSHQTASDSFDGETVAYELRSHTFTPSSSPTPARPAAAPASDYDVFGPSVSNPAPRREAYYDPGESASRAGRRPYSPRSASRAGYRYSPYPADYAYGSHREYTPHPEDGYFDREGRYRSQPQVARVEHGHDTQPCPSAPSAGEPGLSPYRPSPEVAEYMQNVLDGVASSSPAREEEYSGSGAEAGGEQDMEISDDSDSEDGVETQQNGIADEEDSDDMYVKEDVVGLPVSASRDEERISTPLQHTSPSPSPPLQARPSQSPTIPPPSAPISARVAGKKRARSESDEDEKADPATSAQRIDGSATCTQDDNSDTQERPAQRRRLAEYTPEEQNEFFAADPNLPMRYRRMSRSRSSRAQSQSQSRSGSASPISGSQTQVQAQPQAQVQQDALSAMGVPPRAPHPALPPTFASANTRVSPVAAPAPQPSPVVIAPAPVPGVALAPMPIPVPAPAPAPATQAAPATAAPAPAVGIAARRPRRNVKRPVQYPQ